MREGGGGGGEGNESKKGGNGSPTDGAEETVVSQKQGVQAGSKRMRPKQGSGLNAVQSDATKNEVLFNVF